MIREATSEDIRDLAILGFKEYLSYGADRCGLNCSFKSMEEVARRVVSGEVPGECLVATDNTKIVGFFLGFYESASPFDLAQICLHEIAWYMDEWHRGNGVGGALRNAAHDKARENGIRFVSLGVGTGSDISSGLAESYIKNGYKPFQTLFYKTLEDKK